MNKHKNTHATPKSAPARASRTAARRAREGRRAVLLVEGGEERWIFNYFKCYFKSLKSSNVVN